MKLLKAILGMILTVVFLPYFIFLLIRIETAGLYDKFIKDGNAMYEDILGIFLGTKEIK